ncbi:hypothetical protein ACQPZP_05265 [Spirillospora sp. CA-142024]|uniref:hypothetical protein n=1 Tax=Spirillospora sp. CA-142024 TaxID=3240036 RepID=UPI003D8A565A
MSALAALARLHAAAEGFAQPLRRVRHHTLITEPLILAIYNMSGEAAAPLGCMIGAPHADPVTLVVPSPRNRDLRQEFYLRLADVILPFIDQHARTLQNVPTRGDKPDRQRCARAPQILVPNTSTIDYLRRVARSIRFQQAPTPEFPHGDPQVGLLGRWLTFFTDRAGYPGSSMLLPMTDLLAAHWATGQSSLEDASLALLLGWIDPPAGMTGAQGAAAAAHPIDYPPAGPATDPTFDRVVLDPKISAYLDAVNSNDVRAEARVTAALERDVAEQLKPTWEQMGTAVTLLTSIPEAARCPGRWDADRDAFTGHVQHIAAGGFPQPVFDKPIDAAARLARMERAQLRFEDEQALDDPFVLAERRSSGTAFAGVIVEREPDRTQLSSKGRPQLRPRFTVQTADPPPLAQGKMACPSDPKRLVEIREVIPDGPEQHLVVLELVVGMGRVGNPQRGAVPELGEVRAYTAVPEQWKTPDFPSRDQTPWTHGGPPEPDQPGPPADDLTDGANP